MYGTINNGVTWTEKQKLLASDGLTLDHFGWFIVVRDSNIFINSYTDAGERYVNMS